MRGASRPPGPPTCWRPEAPGDRLRPPHAGVEGGRLPGAVGPRGPPAAGPAPAGSQLEGTPFPVRLFPTEPLRLASNLIRRTFNPPCISQAGLSLAGAGRLCRGACDSCRLARPPRGAALAPRADGWSGVPKKTGHRSGETSRSHPFPASPLPCPPGHQPQSCLCLLSHQGLLGKQQSKELAGVQCPCLHGLWAWATAGRASVSPKCPR